MNAPATEEVYVVWQDARFNGFQRDQVAFSRSADGGLTWSTPVRISTHNETQAFTPAIRVDGDGNVGVTYYDFRNDNPATPMLETDVWFTRSTNGGQTWSEERLTPTSFDMRTAPVARGYFTGDYEGLAALWHDLLHILLRVPRSDQRVRIAGPGAVRIADIHAVNRRR